MRNFDRIVATAIGLLAAALLATVFGQVVARYVFGQPFSWVLELDIVLLVWMTLLSGYVGVRRNSHMAVDFVVARWGEASRRAAAVAVHALCALFLVILGWTSFAVIEAMEGTGFASLPIGQPWLYWSVPAGAALMLIAIAARFRGARRE